MTKQSLKQKTNAMAPLEFWIFKHQSHFARPWEHSQRIEDYACYYTCGMSPWPRSDWGLGSISGPCPGIHLEAYESRWGSTSYTEILHRYPE